MIRQCCKCRRVAHGSEWIVPAALDEDNVSHTYCPACAAEEHAAIYDRVRTRRIIAMARSGAFAS